MHFIRPGLFLVIVCTMPGCTVVPQIYYTTNDASHAVRTFTVNPEMDEMSVCMRKPRIMNTEIDLSRSWVRHERLGVIPVSVRTNEYSRTQEGAEWFADYILYPSKKTTRRGFPEGKYQVHLVIDSDDGPITNDAEFVVDDMLITPFHMLFF